MIIILKKETLRSEIIRITQELQRWKNLTLEEITGQNGIVIALLGDTANINPDLIKQISPCIEQVLRVEKPFKRASLEFRQAQPSKVVVPTPNGEIVFGQNQPLVVIAGPCSVESEEMIIETARAVKAAGAQFLRGGAYKPRTSPYSFQGHRESALDFLAQARAATGLGIITEVMDTMDVDKVAAVADILQIGARNMQNYPLLRKVGTKNKPVLLKRGLSATIEEWLMAAEYILDAGNPNVILCERGIRTFDCKYTRNTLDLSVIPVLRSLTHLPIVIDPSHATGNSDFVPAMAKAAIVADTDSLMIEIHPNPAKAMSDGPQSLTLENFSRLMSEMMLLAKFYGRDQILSPPQSASTVTKVHSRSMT